MKLPLSRQPNCDVSMSRHSLHQDPIGPTAIARHYIRDVVYGANDGLITTFAVVSGVAGGSLSTLAVVVIGAANLVADGISMGVGNFLAIRADERAREAADLPEQEAFPWKHAPARDRDGVECHAAGSWSLNGGNSSTSRSI
jgi:hypothetical protein